jgi:ribosomal protein L29
MKVKELKSLKNEEIKKLEDLVSKKRLLLLKNAVKIASGKEKNLKQAWKERKEIAQILTILKEKGLNK